MAGEGVPAGYGSDEFESSIASEMSENSEEEAVSLTVKRSGNQSKETKTSGKSAKDNASSSQTDVKKQIGGGAKKSTVQGQTSSASMRQSVYNEWRRSKENRLAEQQRKETAERIALEKKEKEDKENYKGKCEKAVEDWKERKKEQIAKAQKEKLRDKDKAEAEDREKADRKAATSVEALEVWRDKKGKILIAQHKERKKQELEEAEKKKVEEEEKLAAAKAAFEAWEKKKSETLKEQQQKQRTAKKKKEQAEWEAAIDKETSAKKAYDTWKKQKAENSKLSLSNSLNSSSSSSSLPIRPAWCPARSIHYDDSATAQVKTGMTRDQKHRATKSRLRVTSSPCCNKDDSSLVKVAEDGTILKQKSIHVCCQTLQYWCSCPE